MSSRLEKKKSKFYLSSVLLSSALLSSTLLSSCDYYKLLVKDSKNNISANINQVIDIGSSNSIDGLVSTNYSNNTVSRIIDGDFTEEKKSENFITSYAGKIVWQGTNFNADDISSYLSKINDFENYSISKRDGSIIVYETKINPKIPVFLFHDISEKGDYSLSKNNLEYLLSELINLNFYPINDSQLLYGDFSNVPSGKKICVMNSDDAPNGAFFFDNNLNYESISEDSMIFLLEKYLPKENDKINFTFFISFDKIPFGDYSSLSYKLNYIQDNFYIGNHTLNHKFTQNLTSMEFIEELELAEKELKKYVDISEGIIPIAYPFGIIRVPIEFRDALNNKYGNSLIAYDAEGGYSYSPFSDKFDRLDISRFTVRNSTLKEVLNACKSKNIYESRRIILYLNNEAEKIFESPQDIIYYMN